MAYEAKTWYNNGVVPDDAPEGTVAPALDADNMNRIEEGIDFLHKKKDYSVLSVSIGFDDIPDTAVDYSNGGTTDDNKVVWFYKDLLPESIRIDGSNYGLVLKKYVFPKDYCLFSTRYNEDIYDFTGMRKVPIGKPIPMGRLELYSKVQIYMTVVEENGSYVAYIHTIHSSGINYQISFPNNYNYQAGLCVLIPNERIIEI